MGDLQRRSGRRDANGRIAVGWRVLAYLVVTTGASFAVQFVVFETLRQPFIIAGWPYLLAIGTVGVLITLWFRRHLDRRPFREIGLTNQGPGRVALHLGIGLLGAAVTVAVVFAFNVAAALVVVTGMAGDKKSLVAVIGLSLAGLGFGLATGFFEELQYRGYALANLAERMPLWAAGLVVSALFTPLHILVNPGLPSLLTAFVMSMVLVALRAASGSLWLPIGFHSGYNWIYNQVFPGLALPSWFAATDIRLEAPFGWAVEFTVMLVVFAVVAIGGRHRIRWREPLAASARSSPRG